LGFGVFEVGEGETRPEMRVDCIGPPASFELSDRRDDRLGEPVGLAGDIEVSDAVEK